MCCHLSCYIIITAVYHTELYFFSSFFSRLSVLLDTSLQIRIRRARPRCLLYEYTVYSLYDHTTRGGVVHYAKKTCVWVVGARRLVHGWWQNGGVRRGVTLPALGHSLVLPWPDMAPPPGMARGMVLPGSCTCTYATRTNNSTKYHPAREFLQRSLCVGRAKLQSGQRMAVSIVGASRMSEGL